MENYNLKSAIGALHIIFGHQQRNGTRYMHDMHEHTVYASTKWPRPHFPYFWSISRNCKGIQCLKVQLIFRKIRYVVVPNHKLITVSMISAIQQVINMSKWTTNGLYTYSLTLVCLAISGWIWLHTCDACPMGASRMTVGRPLPIQCSRSFCPQPMSYTAEPVGGLKVNVCNTDTCTVVKIYITYLHRHKRMRLYYALPCGGRTLSSWFRAA